MSRLRMRMVLYNFLLILSVYSFAHCLPYKRVVYVDSVNGVTNNSCWTGGIKLPCKTLSLAEDGEKHVTNAVIAIIQEPQPTIKPSSNESSVSQAQFDNQTCPPWMFLDDSGKCACGGIPYHSVHCDLSTKKTSLLDCYCMTFNSARNETELGRCFFGCDHLTNGTDTLYYPLPDNTANLNDYICGKANRNSTLCGKCAEGFSPLAYSYEMNCVNCTNSRYNWAKYVTVAFAPLTFFFLFVVIFNLNGTSPQLRAFITVCQGLGSPINVRAVLRLAGSRPSTMWFIRLLASVYGVMNLDFFRTILPPICLNLTTLQALALDYAVAFYPLLLVALAYVLISLYGRDVRVIVWLWRPFRKCFSLMKVAWRLQGSVVNAFATFFLLSYVKILDVSFDMLVYSKVYTMNKTSYTERKVLYFDGSVDYFSHEHLPFAIVGFTVVIFVILLPLLLLILYPMQWFQKCLNFLHIQRQPIESFIDCFQGYYKDGTNGTCNCRYFSVLLFFLQIIIFVFFAISRSVYCYSIGALCIILFTVVTLVIQPYKEQFKVYSLTDAMMLLTLASVFITATGGDETDIKAPYFSNFTYSIVGLISTIPLVYLIVLTVWWLHIKKQIGKRFIRKVKTRFRTSTDVVESNRTDEPLPDRMENPVIYQTSSAPLIPIQNSQQHASNKHVNYGSILMS